MFSYLTGIRKSAAVVANYFLASVFMLSYLTGFMTTSDSKQNIAYLALHFTLLNGQRRAYSKSMVQNQVTMDDLFLP